MGARVHHSAVHVRDLDASVAFYRDGLGLDVLMDRGFDGDWPALFDVPTTRLRSVFLGDRSHPDAGVVELVAFGAGPPAGPGARHAAGAAGPSPGPPPGQPPAGFFLLSFFVDVEEVLGRLAGLGYGPFRRIEQPGPAGPVSMVTLDDPDGVLIELIDVAVPAGGDRPGPAHG